MKLDSFKKLITAKTFLIPLIGFLVLVTAIAFIPYPENKSCITKYEAYEGSKIQDSDSSICTTKYGYPLVIVNKKEVGAVFGPPDKRASYSLELVNVALYLGGIFVVSYGFHKLLRRQGP